MLRRQTPHRPEQLQNPITTRHRTPRRGYTHPEFGKHTSQSWINYGRVEPLHPKNQPTITGTKEMPSKPKTLNESCCSKLLNELRTFGPTAHKEAIATRNYCMGLIMLDAGLRVGELVQLQVADLWFANNPTSTLIVRAEIAKKKIERSVPLSDRIRHAIDMMNFHSWFGNLSDYYIWAFTNSQHYHPLTTRQVERIIRQASVRSLGRPIHPHTLRHTFASRLMRRTNIRVVQELLGHSSISSTQIYTHPDEDDKTQAIQSLLNEPPNHNGIRELSPGTDSPRNSFNTPRTNR